MENKEMNTEKIKFYKKHPVLLAWLISIFIGLGYALFTIIVSVIHYEQRDYVWEIITAFTEMPRPFQDHVLLHRRRPGGLP